MPLVTIYETKNLMATRNPLSQNQHDRVIQTAYSNLDKKKHDVYVNLGQQKLTSVSGQYPDIIITEKNDNNVKWIIEVETEDSITQSEAAGQWLEYSKLGGTFYLLVPKSGRNLAEKICIQNSIKARFGTYFIDSFSNILISYE